MPTLYDIKPAFQNLLRPLVRRLARAGVTANQVTLAAVALSALTGTAVWLGHDIRAVSLLVPLALVIRMALNAMDGLLAREHYMQTRLGAVLNELGDVFSDALLYAPLAVFPDVRADLVWAAVWLAAISEMTGVVAVQIGASRRYDGPMGKSDRALVFGCLFLLLGVGVKPGVWLSWALGLVCVLCGWTIINRARHALGEVRK
jgi:CDP-diacylglycerol--glycerol-3-phosphate 3-phosphatidyltransferase